MKRIRRGFFGALIVMLACAAPALAQYISIPDYVGVQAGKAFRTDINNHLSGVTPIAPRLVSLSYSSLPAEADGQLYYCSNCAQTTPCTGGGSGAIAIGQQGQWACNATGSQSIVPPAGDIGGTISSPTVRAAHWTVQTCSTSPCTVTAPVVNCNAASGAIVLDLPAATGSGVPEIIQKIDSSSNGCTLTPAGSDKIDGLSSDSLTVQYQTAHLVDAASGEWNFSRAAFADLLGTIAATQLPASGVTAGSYTSTNLTVDQYGRITTASNGSGGGGGGIYTHTVSATATAPALTCTSGAGQDWYSFSPTIASSTPNLAGSCTTAQTIFLFVIQGSASTVIGNFTATAGTISYDTAGGTQLALGTTSGNTGLYQIKYDGTNWHIVGQVTDPAQAASLSLAGSSGALQTNNGSGNLGAYAGTLCSSGVLYGLTASGSQDCSLFGTFSATPPSSVGCADTSETITGAATTMGCNVAPAGTLAAADENTTWGCYVSAANTVQIHLCAIAAITAAAQSYNVRLIP